MLEDLSMLKIILTIFYYLILSKISASLVITEIMDDPSLVSDINGECFEIHNNYSSNIDPQNYSFTDDGDDSFTITSSLIIEPMSNLVFGCNDNKSSNGGNNPDYMFSKSDFKLDNGSDEIYILLYITSIS